jgi:hypothetical protein
VHITTARCLKDNRRFVDTKAPCYTDSARRRTLYFFIFFICCPQQIST